MATAAEADGSAVRRAKDDEASAAAAAAAVATGPAEVIGVSAGAGGVTRSS